jgi:hypothetical protein
MCAFDPSEYIKEGNTKLSFVFNTDVYGGSGMHWIAVYCDTEKDISFFNSNGVMKKEMVPLSVMSFIDKLRDKLKIKKHIRCKRMQKSNSECGMFCIWYILIRLSGKSHIDAMKQGATDEEMILMRKKFFLV